MKTCFHCNVRLKRLCSNNVTEVCNHLLSCFGSLLIFAFFQNLECRVLEAVAKLTSLRILNYFLARMSFICSLSTIFLLHSVSAGRVDTLERSVGRVRVERDTYVCEGDEGKENFKACLEKYKSNLKDFEMSFESYFDVL